MHVLISLFRSLHAAVLKPLALLTKGREFDPQLLQLLHIRAASRENLLFAFAKTKVQISCAITAQEISTFVFASYI